MPWNVASSERRADSQLPRRTWLTRSWVTGESRGRLERGGEKGGKEGIPAAEESQPSSCAQALAKGLDLFIYLFSSSFSFQPLLLLGTRSF